jgi:hypothetical protein
VYSVTEGCNIDFRFAFLEDIEVNGEFDENHGVGCEKFVDDFFVFAEERECERKDGILKGVFPAIPVRELLDEDSAVLLVIDEEVEGEEYFEFNLGWWVDRYEKNEFTKYLLDGHALNELVFLFLGWEA